MNKLIKKYAKKTLATLCISSLLVVFPISSNAQETVAGKLNVDTIPAPSLKNDILTNVTQKDIAVYLPPSYDKDNKEYPVVFYLTGWADQLIDYTEAGKYNGYILNQSMDSLINSGKVKDMIVVCVAGNNELWGGFFTNSPVTGNWEDYFIKDVVSYVDSHYRTIKDPSGRGICGFSMGGSFALKFAAKYPELFGNVYSISPGIYNEYGLSETSMFNDKTNIENLIKIQNEAEKKPLAEGREEFLTKMKEITYGWPDLFALSMGPAFAPNPNKVLPFDYPYSLQDNKLVKDEAIWAKWEYGYRSMVSEIPKYKDNLLKLGTIGIEYGLQDDNTWIPKGCRNYVQELKNNGIPYLLTVHSDGHHQMLKERLETQVYPFFSERFYPTTQKDINTKAAPESDTLSQAALPMISTLWEDNLAHSDLFYSYKSPISREELVVLLTQVSEKYLNKSLTIDTSKTFTDIDNSYYKDQILKLYSLKVINDTKDGKFNPKDTISIKDASSIVNQLLVALKANDNLVKDTDKLFLSQDKNVQLTREEALVMQYNLYKQLGIIK